jgi:hypothetical protein
MLTSREIFGYLLAVKGAGLIVPLALLDGIRFFDSLSWLYWTGILLSLAVMFSGLALASSAEAARENPDLY